MNIDFIPIKAIASVRPNFFVYFTLKFYFFYFTVPLFQSTHVGSSFYNPLYLNNNIFVIFNYYFILLFCLYLFIFSFVLIFFSLSLSHLSYQYLSFFYFFLLLFMENSSSFLSRSRSDHLPPQVSSSSFSFHGQIIYPPQAPISTTRTTRIKTHKHGLRRSTDP